MIHTEKLILSHEEFVVTSEFVVTTEDLDHPGQIVYVTETTSPRYGKTCSVVEDSGRITRVVDSLGLRSFGFFRNPLSSHCHRFTVVTSFP